MLDCLDSLGDGSADRSLAWNPAGPEALKMLWSYSAAVACNSFQRESACCSMAENCESEGRAVTDIMAAAQYNKDLDSFGIKVRFESVKRGAKKK